MSQKSKLTVTVAVLILLSCSHGNTFAETTEGNGPQLELVWEQQVDPRARPGMANEEDGITVECVEFSADGKLVAAGNGQGEVKIYKTADGYEVHTLVYTTNPHQDFDVSFKGMEVESLVFSMDGQLLAAGGNEQGIKVFRVDDGEIVRTFDAEGAEVDGMTMSPCGKFFAHASKQAAAVRQIGDWEVVHRVPHKEGGAINSIDFTKDGHYMISAGQYERVIVTYTPEWREVRTCLVEPRSSIKSARFSPDEQYIAAGYGSAEQVVVFRFEDASVVKQIPMPCYIEAVAWTPHGRYLLAGGRDEGMLHIFETGGWTEIAAIPVQENASIEYIDTFENLVVVGGEDGHIRLYRMIPNSNP